MYTYAISNINLYKFNNKKSYISNPISFKSNGYQFNSNWQQLNNVKSDFEALCVIKNTIQDSGLDAKELIDKKRFLVDNNANTLVHYATENDYFETLKYLLLHPTLVGAMINYKNSEGKTPLNLAKTSKITNFLLSKGAQQSIKEDLIKEPLITENEDTIGRYFTTPASSAKIGEQLSEVNSSSAVATYIQNTQKNEVAMAELAEQPQKPQSLFGMFKEGDNTEVIDVEAEDVTDIVPISENKGEIAVNKNGGVQDIKINGTEAFKRIDNNRIELKDLVGVEYIQEAFKSNIIKPIVNETLQKGLKDNKVDIPNGILLVAPPGNGKTALVKALGKEASMPVFEIREVKEIEPLTDAIAKNYEKKSQRAIVYIRNLDCLLGAGCSAAQLKVLLNRVMSDAAQRGILFAISAENLDNIPQSILTPGKIDRVFTFKTPELDARVSYIKHYFEEREITKKVATEENIKDFAEKTQGFSIAQIKHIFDDSIRKALNDGKEALEYTDLLEKLKDYSKEQKIPEINEFNKTSIYDTNVKRYQSTQFDAKNFESVAGMPKTKNSIEENLLKYWRNADKLLAQGIQLPAGAIFAGDPGTSKTYMAKAIARSLNIPLYTLKMSEVGTSLVHETSNRIHQLIDQLITKYDETGEASVLLLDEIDSFRKTDSQKDAEEVNTLLQEIERGRNKILFIGTTNEIESLPDSLKRDGRMGTIIHFEHCNKEAAKAIITNMLAEKKDIPEIAEVLNNEQYLDSIAKRCDGMVAASVSAIVNDAIADSIINNISLEEAVNNAVSVRRKKDIEAMLSKNCKCNSKRLNISEDSTIMYDTSFQRLDFNERDPQSLDDLGGMKEIKKTLRTELIDAYSPEMYSILKENKLPITKGCIFYGPSGCGKTTLVKAVANEMKLPLYSLQQGDVGSTYIHGFAKNVSALVKQLAYKYKMTGERSIVFMDEAQQLVPRTTGVNIHNEHKLEEVNFIKDIVMSAEQDGIIYFMATNDIYQIEPAFYENTDRLGLKIYVDYPDFDSRVGIIKKVLSDRPIAAALNNENTIKELAALFEGVPISKMVQSITGVIRESIRAKAPIAIESTIQKLKI